MGRWGVGSVGGLGLGPLSFSVCFGTPHLLVAGGRTAGIMNIHIYI